MNGEMEQDETDGDKSSADDDDDDEMKRIPKTHHPHKPHRQPSLDQIQSDGNTNHASASGKDAGRNTAGEAGRSQGDSHAASGQSPSGELQQPGSKSPGAISSILEGLKMSWEALPEPPTEMLNTLNREEDFSLEAARIAKLMESGEWRWVDCRWRSKVYSYGTVIQKPANNSHDDVPLLTGEKTVKSVLGGI